MVMLQGIPHTQISGHARKESSHFSPGEGSSCRFWWSKFLLDALTSPRGQVHCGIQYSAHFGRSRTSGFSVCPALYWLLGALIQTGPIPVMKLLWISISNRTSQKRLQPVRCHSSVYMTHNTSKLALETLFGSLMTLTAKEDMLQTLRRVFQH
ncbi:uncharacterized protein LOC127454329 isoform X1 [Myxocyprinus asiaticus]|uniref:uncharacterized protein LOC127454329 isoform X1 n=1 Tax=Myxocyprinus asiaticus TaxID=70543 RepID=UPI0022221D25|nr:uncharacterized protein LOC127454329 isoform X1 [Myxocyprinus asiaticus]